MKTAEEILESHLTSMLSRTEDSYGTIDEMKQVPEWAACVKAIEQAQKEAYNQALDDAYLLGKVGYELRQSGDNPIHEYMIDKDSILKLKK